MLRPEAPRRCSGQPRLAAAERTDNVGDAPNVPQFEALAAPRPRQIEGNVGRMIGRREFDEFAGNRHRTSGKVSAHAPDGLDLPGDLAQAALQRGLMGGKRRFQPLRFALQHARDLREAEAEPA